MMPIRYTTPEENDRLLEKQFYARIALRGSVFAMAMNNRWRAYFKERAKQKPLSLVQPRRSNPAQ